jgi:hypothetical protein
MKKLMFFLAPLGIATLMFFSCTKTDPEVLNLLRSIKSQNDSLRIQVTTLQTTADSLAAALRATNSNLNNINTEVDSIRAELAQVLIQINALNTQMTQANANLADIQAQLATLQAKCADLYRLLNLQLTGFTDIDGNQYTSVLICGTRWSQQNLAVKHYRNGDPIPQVTNPSQWANLTTGAWCYYNNDSTNGSKYGILYNWFAINDPRGIAPNGWHVSTDADWNNLVLCLDPNANTSIVGGTQSNTAGGPLKQTGTLLWSSPNVGATNTTIFSALAGGGRDYSGNFGTAGAQGVFWTSSVGPNYNTNAYVLQRLLFNYNTGISRGEYARNGGMSVRIVKD